MAERLGIDVPIPEDLAAYTYALLAASAYQLRFAEALRTPGLRLPLTLDPPLWHEAVDQGRHLIWLHSYAERFRDAGLGRPAHVPNVNGIGWTDSVLAMPADADAISYDEDTHVLTVGSGRVSGVRPDVWAYSVSGMPVVGKWLGYRTGRPAGRAATSTSALDAMRPVNWPDEWNDELLDLLRVLTMTLDRQAALLDLLDRVCAGPLIGASELPVPSAAERKAPATLRGATLDF